MAVWHPNGEYFVVPTKSQGELFFSWNDWMVGGKMGRKGGGGGICCRLCAHGLPIAEIAIVDGDSWIKQGTFSTDGHDAVRFLLRRITDWDNGKN